AKGRAEVDVAKNNHDARSPSVSAPRGMSVSRVRCPPGLSWTNSRDRIHIGSSICSAAIVTWTTVLTVHTAPDADRKPSTSPDTENARAARRLSASVATFVHRLTSAAILSRMLSGLCGAADDE